MTLGLCADLSGSGLFTPLFISEFIYFLFSLLLLSSFCSFCTCVYLKQIGFIPDREDKLFGGSLFCAPYFKNVNLRFSVMYVLVFLLFSTVLFLFSCLRTAAAIYL
ncbi:MAG: hypothetical protein IJV00_01355 [Clostridia bacterium]|nr:hypothetical protein [Clostridia bacterium]